MTFRIVFAIQAGQAPLDQSALKIDIAPRYNREPYAPLEHRIQECWDAKKAKNPNVILFNGLKFRFDGIVPGDKIMMRLGITNYMEFMGTNYLPDEEWINRIPNPDRWLSQPLGVEAVVTTADNFFVLFKRSLKVADHPGWFCCPGGHPEPQPCMDKISFSSDGKTPAEMAEALSERPDIISEEIFDSILLEVHEEINVSKDSLTNLGILGIVENIQCHNKPDVIFHVACNLTKEQIQAEYDGEIKGKEQYESDFLLFLPVEKTAVEKSGLNITPASEACLKMYRL